MPAGSPLTSARWRSARPTLFAHVDIADLIGPVDLTDNDATLVVQFDSPQRLVQTLTATTQTLMLLASWVAGHEIGTQQLVPPLLERRKELIHASFDAAEDFSPGDRSVSRTWATRRAWRAITAGLTPSAHGPRTLSRRSVTFLGYVWGGVDGRLRSSAAGRMWSGST